MKMKTSNDVDSRAAAVRAAAARAVKAVEAVKAAEAAKAEAAKDSEAKAEADSAAKAKADSAAKDTARFTVVTVVLMALVEGTEDTFTVARRAVVEAVEATPVDSFMAAERALDAVASSTDAEDEADMEDEVPSTAQPMAGTVLHPTGTVTHFK